jgi:hypothetical protein
VLLDGESVKSCTVLAVQADGAEELDRLLDRPGAPVLERGGDHAPALAAASTALTMLW